MDRTLLDGLNLFAMLAVFGYNQDHPDKMSLKATVQDQVEVRSLVNDALFPPGLQPSYGVKAGYLLLGSGPEVIRRFPAAPAVKAPPVAAQEETPILRGSLREAANFLKDRHEQIALWIAKEPYIPGGRWPSAGQSAVHVGIIRRSGPEPAILPRGADTDLAHSHGPCFAEITDAAATLLRLSYNLSLE